MQIIHETEYEETMKNTVEPYLSARRRELYVPVSYTHLDVYKRQG